MKLNASKQILANRNKSFQDNTDEIITFVFSNNLYIIYYGSINDVS